MKKGKTTAVKKLFPIYLSLFYTALKIQNEFSEQIRQSMKPSFPKGNGGNRELWGRAGIVDVGPSLSPDLQKCQYCGSNILALCMMVLLWMVFVELFCLTLFGLVQNFYQINIFLARLEQP